ncbi:hypothetical protein GF385_00590 [Candidatus Dependentiae bacterium]|nr:hypothetical protein [Candidatus Dependentiae bacterium]
MNWLLENIIGIVGILVGGFIAYHVYFLSKKINLKDRLNHKENISKKVETILDKIRSGGNSKVELINIKKYVKNYPHNNEENRYGYTYLGAELKSLRFDGVEFFCEVKEVCKKEDNNLALKESKNSKREKYNVFVAGLIPYEWIEYVDIQGDEFSYRPQFFSNFKGKEKSPYKYLTYYKESEVYNEGSDPMDMKWSRIEVNN